mmetsp:Transcript_4654/g.15398  ORF Transcript_4654/g.15398 Transcript_4654/m.15398 type:complete len:200 (-) Transcript_4654:1063-1662(-)
MVHLESPVLVGHDLVCYNHVRGVLDVDHAARGLPHLHVAKVERRGRERDLGLRGVAARDELEAVAPGGVDLEALARKRARGHRGVGDPHHLEAVGGEDPRGRRDLKHVVAVAGARLDGEGCGDERVVAQAEHDVARAADQHVAELRRAAAQREVRELADPAYVGGEGEVTVQQADCGGGEHRRVLRRERCLHVARLTRG